jgi:hypothetical protein
MPMLTNPAAPFYGLERAKLRHAALIRPEWRMYLFLENGEEDVLSA